MFYVYILKVQRDGRLYKGITDHLEKRIEQHNAVQNKSTKGFRPWSLIYHENICTRIEAREREKYIKSGNGREFLKDFLKL